MALADNLAVYYALDDATDSAGSNNLTNSGVTFSTGKVGNAGFFTASESDYMEITDNADVSISADATIQSWVRISGTGSNQNFVSKWGSTAANQDYLLYYNSSTSRFQFAVRDAAEVLTQIAANNFGAPSVDTWYLIHAWHDATNDILGIAVNAGTADTTSYSLGVNDSGQSFNLGSQEGGTASFLDGALDEVAIWKRVLSSAERTELYNSGSGRDYTYVSGGGGGGGTANNYYHMLQQLALQS